MKPNYSQQPTSRDHALLRRTLLTLTATQKIICVLVVVIVALVWYDLLNRLVAFGKGIDYSGLHALGVQAVALLQQYNPFFWWAVVALCTLIIAYFLYGFVQSSQRRVRLKLVSEETIGLLASQLSEPAKEVLRWSWQDRRQPITVGNLQRAAFELRNARASKIRLAQRHAALLNDSGPAIASPVHRTLADNDTVHAEVVRDEVVRTAAAHNAAEHIVPDTSEAVHTGPAEPHLVAPRERDSGLQSL